MSDNLFKVIPETQGFLPDVSTHEAAIRKLEEFTPDGEQVEVHVYPHLEFIDQGANLEAIVCPSCKQRLRIDYFSDNDPVGDWWQKANVEADIHRGEDVFELNPDTICKMPCCQAQARFVDLEFDWPGGFARFELTALNPDLETLTQAQIQELEEILGCRLKLIRAHY